MKLLAWWVNHYGAEKVLGFGAVKLREGRDLLRAGGRQPGTVNRFLSVLRSAWTWGRGRRLRYQWQPAVQLETISGQFFLMSPSMRLSGTSHITATTM